MAHTFAQHEESLVLDATRLADELDKTNTEMSTVEEALSLSRVSGQ